MARKASKASNGAGARRGRPATQAALRASGNPRRGRPPGRRLIPDASRQQTKPGRATKRSASGADRPARARQEAETALPEIQPLLDGLRGLESAIEALGSRLEPLLRQLSEERDPTNAGAEPTIVEGDTVPQQLESRAPHDDERAEPIPSD
jgi:hypothetical protein